MKQSLTRPSLLLRIRDPQDASAWAEFVDVYMPLLHAYALRQGLQDADAADVAQETVRNLVRVAPGFRYDPQRGTFRGWLLTVARNEIRKFLGRHQKHGRGSGDSQVRDMLESLPDHGEPDQRWEREYQLHVFQWAARQVRNEFREGTWQAFWRTVVEDQAIERVAQDLKITSGAVYIARSRVTARLRQVIAGIEG